MTEVKIEGLLEAISKRTTALQMRRNALFSAITAKRQEIEEIDKLMTDTKQLTQLLSSMESNLNIQGIEVDDMYLFPLGVIVGP